MRCALCELPTPDGERARYFELELCRACGAGEITVPLRMGGRELEVVTYTPGSQVGNRDVPARIVAIGKVHAPCQARLSVSRRSWWHQLLGLVSPRVTTGDDIFDDHIAIRGGRDPASTRLFARESVRASLLECTTSGRVAVRNGIIYCSRSSPELGYQDVNETKRAMLIMLHYLGR